MKKLIYISLVIVALTTIISCEDKLDVSNPNNQTSADFWQTEDEIAEGLIAVYNRLLTDGLYARMTPSLNDGRGDDVYSESPWTIYPLTADFTVLSDYDVLEWPWREWFIMIYRANLVLQHIDDVDFETPAYKNRLQGQALFLRAFTYYNLTESYQTVPIIREVPKSTDDIYTASSSREDILQFIIDDLTEARGLLPEKYTGLESGAADEGQLGRAARGAATGLLARVYMVQEDWGKARTMLEDIINSKVYGLIDNYGENFNFDNENNKESIFEIQFGNFGTDENWWSYSTTNWRQASCLNFNYGLLEFQGWGDFRPTQWLYEQFKVERTTDNLLDPRLFYTLISYEEEYDGYTDGRSNIIFSIDAYRDTTAGVTTLQAGEDLGIAKYSYARIPGYTAESEGIRINSTINYRFMRYAEILLNYAEVLYELEQYDAAYSPLNEIRDRADLAIIPQGSLSVDSLYNQILHQRVLELSIEGLRHFDIKRWGWFYDQDKLNELITHDDEFATWRAGHEYLPIPSRELDVNKNLKKNAAN